MSPPVAKDTAIVIPARNEEARIGACLSALSAQASARVSVILVVNNTTDRTIDIARAVAIRSGLDMTVVDLKLSPSEGVGTARKFGCDHALRTMPDLRYLLTTDADCITAPNWVARNLAHLQIVDVVCGKVDLIADEAEILDGMNRKLAERESVYRGLVQDIYATYSTSSTDISGTHGEAAGASLSFGKPAYLAVGGFAPIVCGEDRRIVRSFRRAGYEVRHASDVTVRASCRLSGRATGGMSDALRARFNGTDYLIDDCLPPADWLVRQAVRKALGPWPPYVPAHLRLNVQDLPRHIKLLRNFNNSERLISASNALAAALPSFEFGMPTPDKRSAIIPNDPDLRARTATDQCMPITTETNGSGKPTSKGA
ncbi:glycosyltransferase family A protein [uncultured Marivita sp.]|uniref:glycosyltransferase n=1 Tax=uncultured Marivita sp. TaxID=888080 RepID=UPI002624DF6F|nr:glycosyltransferase family A protein [uncultured Marivita sp.]